MTDAQQDQWRKRSDGLFAYLSELGWTRRYHFILRGALLRPIGMMDARQRLPAAANDNVWGAQP